MCHLGFLGLAAGDVINFLLFNDVLTCPCSGNMIFKSTGGRDTHSSSPSPGFYRSVTCLASSKGVVDGTEAVKKNIAIATNRISVHQQDVCSILLKSFGDTLFHDSYP